MSETGSSALPNESPRRALRGDGVDRRAMDRRFGIAVGVLAKLLLFFGHVLDTRFARQCREECRT